MQFPRCHSFTERPFFRLGNPPRLISLRFFPHTQSALPFPEAPSGRFPWRLTSVTAGGCPFYPTSVNPDRGPFPPPGHALQLAPAAPRSHLLSPSLRHLISRFPSIECLRISTLKSLPFLRMFFQRFLKSPPSIPPLSFRMGP